MCKHTICQSLSSQGCGKGVACIIYNNYYDRQTRKYTETMLLGKERKGTYMDKYNLCAGDLEISDDGCFLLGLARELSQEFKIDLTKGTGVDWVKFDRVFKDLSGDLRCFVHTSGTYITPVFVGVVVGVSRGVLNNLISQCNQNTLLPWCQREMECVDWFKISNGKQLEGKICVMTTFAEGALKRFSSLRKDWNL